jgi:hypothetical protein
MYVLVAADIGSRGFVAYRPFFFSFITQYASLPVISIVNWRAKAIEAGFFLWS